MGYITEITAKSFVPAVNNACKLVGQVVPLEPARDCDSGRVGCCG